MKRKFTALLALTLALSMTLCGCGAKEDPAPSAPAASAPATSAPAESTPTEPTSYATKPIEVVVPWGAGGSNDLCARALADSSEKYFGQPMTILNQPGAATTVTQFMNEAKPDGYEFIVVTMGTFTTTPLLNEVDYDWYDFDVVCAMTLQPNFLIVRADSEFNSLEDIQNATRQVSFASTGATSSTNILPSSLFEAMGIDYTGIAYSGGSESIAALLGGHVDCITVDPSNATKYVESGDVKILGVFDTERFAAFPEVPTMMESGYDLALSVSNYILAPKGLPEDVLEYARYAFEQMKTEDTFVNFAANSNLPVLNYTPEEATARYESEYATAENMLKSIGLI